MYIYNRFPTWKVKNGLANAVNSVIDRARTEGLTLAREEASTTPIHPSISDVAGTSSLPGRTTEEAPASPIHAAGARTPPRPESTVQDRTRFFPSAAGFVPSNFASIEPVNTITPAMQYQPYNLIHMERSSYVPASDFSSSGNLLVSAISMSTGSYDEDFMPFNPSVATRVV